MFSFRLLAFVIPLSTSVPMKDALTRAYSHAHAHTIHQLSVGSRRASVDYFHLSVKFSFGRFHFICRYRTMVCRRTSNTSNLSAGRRRWCYSSSSSCSMLPLFEAMMLLLAKPCLSRTRDDIYTIDIRREN